LSTPTSLIKILKILSRHGLRDRRLDIYYGMLVVAGVDVTEDSALGKKLLKAGLYLHDRVGWCVPV
jgi:hypothetical protein